MDDCDGVLELHYRKLCQSLATTSRRSEANTAVKRTSARQFHDGCLVVGLVLQLEEPDPLNSTTVILFTVTVGETRIMNCPLDITIFS